ncbi:hypothetical protein ENH_00027370 [Eimeria necatrix]|uniref:Reverse transcriptase, related n=1 Tax=Eimeria necatrix TaxID=51315 RepID=U6MK37_9EIME|nr:hypothetical protein ENH_00027370 [Eimeria necatrix]CDJ62829.1 hypothetical protein ENH_00027370 [Eimeria necatrix]
MSDEDVQGTQPPSETQLESGLVPMRSEEAPWQKTDSSGKSAEATEEDCRPEAIEIIPHWWREISAKESCNQGGALCYVGAKAVLRVELAGSSCEALLDTGASRSFIKSKTVERLQLRVRRLPKEHRFTVATGEQLRIDRVVTGLTMWSGYVRFSGDFFVVPVPYDLVVGLGWLTEHKVAWFFQSDKLQTYVNGQWCELPVVRTGEETLQDGSHIVAPPRSLAEQAYDILAKQVSGMSAEDAAIFLQPPPKRYKSHAKTKAKARITSLIRQAAADAKKLRARLHGLHFILALPDAGSSVALRFTDKWQGALCCVLIGNRPKASCCSHPLASTALKTAEDEGESPWPTAKLDYTLFDEWINSTEAQAIPFEITKVLKEYRAVFPDNLPEGLPPKRPHGHHILLVPGKLPAKSAIYRMCSAQRLLL